MRVLRVIGDPKPRREQKHTNKALKIELRTEMTLTVRIDHKLRKWLSHLDLRRFVIGGQGDREVSGELGRHHRSRENKRVT